MIPIKSFSLKYNKIASRVFFVLFISGLVSSTYYSIDIALSVVHGTKPNLFSDLFVTLSALGTVWGLMAYHEFTSSSKRILETAALAHRLDPIIGKYQYKTYNPELRDFEDGYAPVGPIDFWDKETYAPTWLDKAKYWHILLGLQAADKEIVLQVVSDMELSINTGSQNIATTQRETVVNEHSSKFKRYRYRVKIPQWVVLSTDYVKSINQNLHSDDFQSLIRKYNKTLLPAVNEIMEREKPRIKYPWLANGFLIYLNKSLPLRLIYNRILKKLPNSRRSILDDTNEGLVDVDDDKLCTAIYYIASIKGINSQRIDYMKILVTFLSKAYSNIGLGEGSTSYHNFHHSLEVSYMALQMVPNEMYGYKFFPREIEILIIAALLHDYDPLQERYASLANGIDEDAKGPKGPRVYRTIKELRRLKIHDAYFTMSLNDFEEFLNHKLEDRSDADIQCTPDYTQPNESLIVEAYIWRTDFPYHKRILSQKKFSGLLLELKDRGQNIEKVSLLSEILWLSDLSVTYMGSDPVRAWTRVTSLYDELYLPRLEAVSRTDSFFSDFAETKLFLELINSKNFPSIFKNRWNLVYQFFHEGNPSTAVVRTINIARKSYLKINMEIGFLKADNLYNIASNNWSEYFIGISKNQQEVLVSKSKFMMLEPQNAAAFWGDTRKLTSALLDQSIDNFLMRMPRKYAHLRSSEISSLKSLIEVLSLKLVDTGTLQVMTDIEQNSSLFIELTELVLSSGFSEITTNSIKNYYASEKNRDDDFSDNISILVFRK